MSDFSKKGLINKEFYKNIQNNKNTIYCDVCKFEWKYKDTPFFESELKNQSGDKFFVVAFICRQCGKEFLIVVNNETTLSDIKELRRIENNLEELRTKAQGKPTPIQVAINESLIIKHKEIANRIGEYQDKLKEDYLSKKPELTLVKRIEIKNKS